MLKYRRWSGSYEKNRTGIYYRHGIYRCVAGRAVSHGRGRRADGCYRQPCPAGERQRKPIHLPHPPRQIHAREHDWANILKDTYLSLCKGGVDLFTANGLFTANSNYEKNVEFNLLFTEGSIFADSIKDEETYYIVFRPIGFTPAYRFQLSLKNGAHETMTTSAGAIVASVSGAVLKKTARIQLYFFNVSGAIPIVSGSKFQMIFSKNPDCIYEPYTGGAPSPSPSYPQEIESAGQDGEIEVEVLSGNLFDKSAAYDLTQSGGWSASFDGEELKVVGNNITIGSIRLFNYKKTLPAGLIRSLLASRYLLKFELITIF